MPYLISIVIIIIILSIGFLIVNYFEIKKFKVTKYCVISSKLPEAFNHYKIALITDLHNCVYGKDNQPLIESIRKQQPDCIMIAGDMIVKGEHCNTKVSYNLLQELSKEYPIYYANGNHEHRFGQKTHQANKEFEEYKEKLKALGVQYLENDSVTLQKDSQCITIYGLDIEESYYTKFKNHQLTKETMEQYIGKSDSKEYNIVIAHNPVFFETYAKWGADMVLAGHVHGGIVRLPFLGGVISTQGKLFPKYDTGLFKEGNSCMVLSSGLGCHTIKLRVFNRAELVMIELQN